MVLVSATFYPLPATPASLPPSVDAIISGTVVAGYFPTDVGGPSQWLFRGHLHDELDATFTATAHSFHGNATDLCAALSPPQ
jgi:hypothetical protein